MKEVQLKEICQLLNGKAFKQSELLDSGKYPVLRVGNFFSDKEYYYSNLELESNKYCDNGDLLFAWSASFGPKIWYGNKVIFHYHIWRIDINNSMIYKKYLYYYLLFISEKIKRESHGGIMLHTTKQEMEERKIFLPSIDRQKSESFKLDKIIYIIEMKKKQLLLLDNLIKSRFVEMFGDPIINDKNWKQSKLKDVSLMKLSYGSGASAVKFDNNVRYIRITDIDSNGNLNDDVVSPSIVERKYLLNDGDILFARSGATVGKTYRYRKKDGVCIFAGYLIRLIPNQDLVLPDYVFHYTKSSYYQNFIDSNMKVVAQPNINAQQYGNLMICLPPIELQNEFADFVRQVDKSKFAIQQSLDEMQVLYDSLMQEYFG